MSEREKRRYTEIPLEDIVQLPDEPFEDELLYKIALEKYIYEVLYNSKDAIAQMRELGKWSFRLKSTKNEFTPLEIRTIEILYGLDGTGDHTLAETLEILKNEGLLPHDAKTVDHIRNRVLSVFRQGSEYGRKMMK